MNIQVACIGAAHRDIKSQALQEIVIRSSNPVCSESMWGGVARNIAENLARLSTRVTMVSRVGTDSLGIGLRSFLDNLCVDTKFLTLSLTNFTASYTALLGVDGDMFVALADMEIYHELTPKIIETYIDELCSIPVWVVDLNLPIETIQYLSDKAPEDCLILTMPVSVAKLKRIGPILSKTHSLILNRFELSKLSKIDAVKDLEGAINVTLAKGVDNIIVTNGPSDVILGRKEEGMSSFSVDRAPVFDTTGAGDALAAGYLYGLIKGEDLETSLNYGIQAARLTVGSTLSVYPDLSQKKLKEMILI